MARRRPNTPSGAESTPSPSRHPLLAGVGLGKGTRVGGTGSPWTFVLERRLGQGASGEVWAAHDLRAQRLVALKFLNVIPPAAGGDVERFREWFEREVDMLRRASGHRGLVHIHVAGEWRRRWFIAQDLVEGESLREMIRTTGRIAPTEALRIGAQVADALVHLHGREIVHRDVKPSNIQVAWVKGVLTAVLIDFGIARVIRKATESGFASAATGTAGSFPYLSPEQISRASLADGRSDVYGLGATLYHALSGRKPFADRFGVELIRAIETEAPPPLDAAFYPPGTGTVIARAMEKAPAARFEDAEVFRDALLALLPPGQAL